MASELHEDVVARYQAARTHITSQAKTALRYADGIPEPQRRTSSIVATVQQLTYDTYVACTLINRCQYYAHRLENAQSHRHHECVNAVRYLAYNGTPDQIMHTSNRIGILAQSLRRMSDIAYRRA